jgi:hypothetical protein
MDVFLAMKKIIFILIFLFIGAVCISAKPQKGIKKCLMVVKTNYWFTVYNDFIAIPVLNKTGEMIKCN